MTNLYVFVHLCARRLPQLIFLALEQPSKNKISSKNVEIIWKKGPLSTSKYYLLILAAPNLTRIFLIIGAIKESHLFFRSKFLSQSWRILKSILNNLLFLIPWIKIWLQNFSRMSIILWQIFRSEKTNDYLTIYSSYFYIKIRTHSMIFFTVY